MFTLFTASYAHGVDAAIASLPSFSAPAARGFAADHGLAVRAIRLRVADAEDAFSASVAAGARPAFEPVELGLGFRFAEVELYGDVAPLRELPGRREYALPSGFENVSNPGALDYGLRRFDHIVGNVPMLAPVSAYIAGFTGFHEFAEFTAEDVGTAENGLNSVVLANNSETVLIPPNDTDVPGPQQRPRRAAHHAGQRRRAHDATGNASTLRHGRVRVHGASAA
jgi:4-hydroxyphenylpyruvate dioxygenase